MTLPDQEVRALNQTREFLRELLDPKKTPRVPREIRRRASGCLHHFPFQIHIERRWSDEVCEEHGNMRQFCRECRQKQT